MPKGVPNKRYTPEFKRMVVETMKKEHLSIYAGHFKQEIVAYLDYYNNRRIKAKLKGLPPAIHRQQALSAA